MHWMIVLPAAGAMLVWCVAECLRAERAGSRIMWAISAGVNLMTVINNAPEAMGLAK